MGGDHPDPERRLPAWVAARGLYVARLERRTDLAGPGAEAGRGSVLPRPGVDPARSQGWLGYAGALLAFNLAGFFLLYGILRLLTAVWGNAHAENTQYLRVIVGQIRQNWSTPLQRQS